MTKPIRLILMLLLAGFAVLAGAAESVTWSAKLDRDDVRAGEVARIVVTGKLEAGWHTYSIVPVPKGPKATSITVTGLELAGPIEEAPPKQENDPNFGKVVGLFSDTATFYAPVRITAAGHPTVTVNAMTCNAQVCNPPKDFPVEVSFTVAPGLARAEFKDLKPLPAAVAQPAQAGPVDATTAQIRKAQDSGLLPFMLLAFGAGLLSLLTPCVFPMIPITVSYFTKQNAQPGEKTSYGGPIAYCLGIIGTFTALGVIVSASGVRLIATNVWVNLGLATLFIVLAASLFGVFEIRLPSRLVNTAGSKSRAGGLIGPLLMGLTFTLTSFTCTVPFVGTLLATSTQGGLLFPIMGMLAFSTAFALPFFLLALFPSFLSKLPRSGAWLVTVKAFMGFLELMAALKFLSNVDLAWHLTLLTRPVFLAIWAATAAIGGFYLLGWLRLSHDTGTKPGLVRRAFGLATLGLAVYCLAGLQGRPLGQLSAFLPPDPYPGQAGKRMSNLVWISTYDAAVAEAKASGKNVFIDFTGIYCTNCRDIEENVFTRPEVERELGKFVLARLFTDEGSAEDKANQALQRKFTGVETLPIYVVVSPDGKVLKVHQQEPPIENADQFLAAIRPFSGVVVVSGR